MRQRDSTSLGAFPSSPSSLRRLGTPVLGRILFVGCCLLGPVAFSPAVPAGAAASGPANTNSVVAVPDLTLCKSAFNPKLGKDPFFPKSRRLEAGKPVVPLPPTLPLVLKGISGAKGRRLALINNRSFEAGEQVEFKINNQSIRVRCVEIREQSAVISIEGMGGTQELILNQR